MPPYEELKVFSGSSNPGLAASVCEYLGIPNGKIDVFKFTNDNTFVKIQENVRQRDVYLMQSFSLPVNDHVMEMLIMIDAAKRASAGRITAVIPYYGYGRTDKKDQPRVPITARLVADLLTVAGADRVLTVDLHAGQIQGFFNVPVDELTAHPILAAYFQQLELRDAVVVAVDIGISKRARDFAERLGLPLAIVEKRRVAGTRTRQRSSTSSATSKAGTRSSSTTRSTRAAQWSAPPKRSSKPESPACSRHAPMGCCQAPRSNASRRAPSSSS